MSWLFFRWFRLAFFFDCRFWVQDVVIGFEDFLFTFKPHINVLRIHKAYEEALGRCVPPSTVYRMLDRHKWRKVMPRPKHPKSKPEEQEAYKKNHRKN